MINGWCISCEIVPRWISMDCSDGKSTLVQVMAWAVRQQAITWANVDPDLCCHMASLGHNELTHQHPFVLTLQLQMPVQLTHRGRETHICVGKLTIIASDNGLSPGRRQAIIWTNAGILLIRPLGTNFSEILIKILTFSLKKMHLKMSSAKFRPFCLGLNVLMNMRPGNSSV